MRVKAWDKLENQFDTDNSGRIEWSAWRKFPIKRELNKVIINYVMLQIRSPTVQFPHSLILCFFLVVLSLTIQYIFHFFFECSGGKKQRKGSPKNDFVKEVNEQNWDSFSFNVHTLQRMKRGKQRKKLSLLWRNLNPLCIRLKIKRSSENSRHTLLHQLTVFWIFSFLNSLFVCFFYLLIVWSPIENFKG